MTELLKLRKDLKSKKPKFLRQDGHKLHLPQKWVRPRGIHNKMRLKIKGHRRKPSTGFGSPRLVKFTLKSGLIPINVHNKEGLDKIDIKTHVAIIASAVGNKKRIEIINHAISKKMKIGNVSDPAKELENIKQSLAQRKKKASSTIDKKTKSKQEAEKKAQEKEQEKISPDQEKKIDQQEEKKALQKEHIHEPQAKITEKKSFDKFSKKDHVRAIIPSGGDRGVQDK